MLIKPDHCKSCILGCAPFGKMTGYVPADGTGDNGVLIVLEAAGGDEEESGIPVVGRAGQYLFSQLARVGIEREGFRIHNALSCRPPANKLAGMPYERSAIEHCSPLLDATIEDMRRKCAANGRHFTILALGKIAFKRIMGYDDKHPIMRKDYLCYVHWSERYGAWVIAADHPSHLMQGKNSRVPILQFAARRALEIAEAGFTYDNPEILCDPDPTTFNRWIDDYEEAVKADSEIMLAYDIETPYKTGKDEEEIAKEDNDDYTILRISFAWRTSDAISIPWAPEYMAGIERLFAMPTVKVGWNSAIYDDPRIRAQVPVSGSLIDGMVAWHVLNSALPKGLGFVTPFFAQNAKMWKHLSEDLPAFYNGCDSHYTIVDMLAIRDGLKRNNQWGMFHEHFVRLNEALNYMSGKGVPLDAVKRQEAEDKLTIILAEIEERMKAAVPEEAKKLKVYKKTPKSVEGLVQVDGTRKTTRCLGCGGTGVKAAHFKSIGKKRLKGGEAENPCLGQTTEPVEEACQLWAKRLEFKISNKSLQDYQKIVGHSGVNDRKKGTITFNANALTILQKRYQEDPLYRIIGEHREVQKLLSTYVGVTDEDGRVRGGMPVGRDGRIHTIFTHNPSTLRLASQDPNLQNLPRPGKADDLQTIIRNLVVAGEGHTFVARDFSGIEAVLVGYEARSPGYIRLAKQDVHTFYTIYALHGLGDPRVSASDLPELSWSDERLFAHLAHYKSAFKHDRNSLFKHLTHAINFGQGAKGAQEKILKETLVLQPVDKIQRVMDIYKELFPAIPTWHNTIRLQADRDGFLRNAFGYTHRFNRVFAWTKKYGRWTKEPGDDAQAVLAFKPQSNAAGIIKEAILRLFFDRFEEGGQFLRLQVHDEIFCEVEHSYTERMDKILEEEMGRPVNALPLPASWGMGEHLVIGTEGKAGPIWGQMH